MSGNVPDEVDKKILSALARDGRTPHVDIAAECGITRQTVASRIRRLEKEGIIKGYRAVVDMEKIGLNSFFILFLKLDVTDQATIKSFIDTLKEDPHVIMDVSVTGEWDAMLLLAFKDVREYESYISHIRLSMGHMLKDSKSHVVLNFYKSPDEWAPYQEQS
ncbi:Lrp/AsnC family transcriptional regulator [Methanocella arvoryzae]|uniref:Transcriptional regulator (AsnC/Lrp family) n=1 Tax=Methanocella arvoryzae (strain DSM 22066 / NBRC 105507 / MRE50) TaxID=351160 RepID=Q0W1B3_METAR|nr:Lrp/AsnC family transcriptional regulator [Methanocella arvoryzae]CAJ37830.1 putative transcriptional regulator (AsnC/Lrp family) [Methanocella arvoryzae MRE50]